MTGWRAIARSCGVSDDVAFELWQRAQAEAGPNFSRAEALYRRMVEESVALEAITEQLESSSGVSEPGKSTRVIEDDLGRGPVAHDPILGPAELDPTARLKNALVNAVRDVEKAAFSVSGANAQTINEALRRFMRGQGKPLVSVDDGAIAQVLRLADALVTIVEHGRGERKGKPLPASLQSELETKLGVDLGDLRVHDDAKAAEAARGHDALAFAQGKNVYFGEGKYDPSSSEGRELIAHEATHVAQQRGGGTGSGVSAPGSAVEREADRVAGAFAAGMAPGAREFAITERAGAGTISRKDSASAAAPAAAAALHLKATTTASAASGGTDRWTVGVGEEVKFEAIGGETGDWTASGGTPATGNGASLLWNAPGTAGQFTIKLKTTGGEATRSVAVIQPSGVKFTVYDTYGPASDDMMGAGMRLDMSLDPLNVSFNKIKIREKPGGAHGLTGYFRTVNADLSHNPESAETSVREDNKTGKWDDAHLMDDRSDPWPKPLQVGSMTWDIPYLYTAGDVTDAPFSIVRQTMGIVDSRGTVTVTKGTAAHSRTPTPAADERRPAQRRTSGEHVEKVSGRHGGKLMGDQGAGGGSGTTAGPTNWNINLAGMALDLSERLAGAHDNGDGTSTIQIDRTLGPVKIASARYRKNAAGDRVESATLTASIESGSLRGTTGSLTVNSEGRVSGSLEVPIEKANFLRKSVRIEIGDGTITGRTRLQPNDLLPPDFPIRTSELELVVSYTEGSGVSMSLTGSASVSVENGFASGVATMEIEEFRWDSTSGISFRVRVSGRVDIHGLANTEAAMTYDGTRTEFLGGTSNIRVVIPGIEGTALLEFGAGRLSLDSRDLHFTLPRLDRVRFDQVHLEANKLVARLSLNEVISFPLPGGAALELSDSSLAIDGMTVNGHLTGTLRMPGGDGFRATARVGYEQGGNWTGSITIDGGANLTFGGVEVGVSPGSTLTVRKEAAGLSVEGDVTGTVRIPALAGSNIEAHLIYRTGEELQLSVDANVPLTTIYRGLSGNLNVRYNRGGGAASAFAFSATNIGYAGAPVNGQVLFSEFEGRVEGERITGSLTAAAGTVIRANGVTVTINGGFIRLLPDGKLHGALQAGATAGGAAVEANIGWENDVFTWSAEAVLDLAALTGQKVIGRVRAAAGSGGVGRFTNEGPVTFGPSLAALQGVSIDTISGDRNGPTFDLEISAENAANRLLRQVPGVGVTLTTTRATVHYASGNLSMAGHIRGSAWYPKEGNPKIRGTFDLSYDNATGFTGRLEDVSVVASNYFQSTGGTADLNSGDVALGQPTTFRVPGFASGTVNQANVNVKT
ncbi:MAG: DUF4157 domain-containing protein, partial [Deltaproteobacteria bacterium]|nr:DUF4157 domain-containing protein [Deltaproteobacteria bacterium]